MTRKPSYDLTLRGNAIRAISASDLDEKVRLTRDTAARWFGRTLSVRSPLDPPLPERPGRPEKPELVPPRMLKKRSLNTEHGRIALMHALAHIELNAIDLALDIVARFAAKPIPRSFFDGWMKVADDEARHFTLLRDRLKSLGADYGDMPAHDGLWQSAHQTRNDLEARLAVVPLILEARGLDVTPSLLEKMIETGDHETAAILDVIYNDEKTHVAVGAKWFRFFCARNKIDPAARFRELVRANFRGELKPPFNELARAEAGLTPSFYRSLSPVSI
ncbi:MAG: ferritin-like domain-containing protein [Ochrobactrum anthropi]|uniref:Ferritin-like domain-containing protein n=1 Tax=Brucella anthropi TaxID=529 RepID=A0A8I0N1H5_BRUAN|nr:ferritin-like domain-containing protein [Brucella anthropi]MBE0559941.1 ferritin-like domain-containing protein [Brucella anthropi]